MHITRLLFLSVICLAQACSSDSPPPPPAAVDRAFQLAAEGKHSEAKNLLEAEEKKNPADAVWPFYLGRLHARYFNELNRGSIKFLELKTLPHKPFGQYLEMKNPDGSIAGYQYQDFTPVLDHYLRAIKKDDKFADAYIEAAMVYAALFRTADALALLGRAGEKMPDNYRFPFLQAYIHRQLGDNDKALAAYDQAVARNNKSSDAHLFRGTLLLKLDRTKEAGDAFSRVIDLDKSPKDVEDALSAYFLHFYIKGTKGDRVAMQEAVSWGERHLAAFRKHPRLLIRLGKACYLAGHKDRALRHLKEGLDEQPTDPQALTILGELQTAAGQHEEAIHSLSRSLALQDRAMPRFLLGSLYLKENKPGQALVHLERAAAMRPDDPEILHTLATALAAARVAPERQRIGWRNYLAAARKKGHSPAAMADAEKKLAGLAP